MFINTIPRTDETIWSTPMVNGSKYVVAVSGCHVYRLVSAVRLRAERGKRRIIYIKSLQASLDTIQNSVDLMKTSFGPH